MHRRVVGRFGDGRRRRGVVARAHRRAVQRPRPAAALQALPLLHRLGAAGRHSDPAALRDEFYRHCDGGGYFNYGMSQANEIVSKGLAVFALAGGDPRQARLAAYVELMKGDE